jgi:hypothetical protein
VGPHLPFFVLSGGVAKPPFRLRLPDTPVPVGSTDRGVPAVPLWALRFCFAPLDWLVVALPPFLLPFPPGPSSGSESLAENLSSKQPGFALSYLSKAQTTWAVGVFP